MDRGHGRLEERIIKVSDELVGELAFPYAATVFQIERRVCKLDGSEPRTEFAYGVTSLPGTTKKDAARVLRLARGHWIVENGLHWVRDVTFDEDRSQVRKGSGPRVMATLRNLAISILRLAGARSIARALRWCARDHHRALRLVGIDP